VAVAFFCLSPSDGRAQDAPPPASSGGIAFRGATPDLVAQDSAPQPSPGIAFRTANPDVVAQDSEPPMTPPTAGPQPGPQIPFHNSRPEMNSEPGPDMNSGENQEMNYGGQAQGSMDNAAAGESQKEIDDLGNQKQTLDAEIQYAQSKLDVARKNLDVASGANNSDLSDKYEQEVHDWDARVRALKSQEEEVDAEIQSANVAQQAPVEAPEDSLILPGDNLEIYVVEDSSFNGRYQVRRGGYIIMPAVGRIPVAGKSMQGAEQEVRKALEISQLQHATVMVEKVEGNDIESGPVIFLAGEFKNARPFRIPPGTKPTVVNVILSCGGVTDRADLTRVKVMRVVANKSLVETEDVANILQGGSGLTSDLTLTDGDVIIVSAGADNFVFVTGCVGRPGSQYIRGGDHLTAYSAILDAGGFGRFADLKRVYVLRASPDGTKVRIPVNIIAIQHGHEPDLPLTGGDILIVPEKFFSF